MTYVVEMRPSERVTVDMATLDDVFHRLGNRGAEAFVMEAVEEISDTLAEVEGFIRTGNLPEVEPRARRVSIRSAEIGLSSLARVARDLSVAARLGDGIAHRAIWERLVRIGDRSLAQVWEVPELSM